MFESFRYWRRASQHAMHEVESSMNKQNLNSLFECGLDPCVSIGENLAALIHNRFCFEMRRATFG